ncbi:hypothetical protein CPC08DRAFT_716046 [Agrocybe pediades]|nr:hypothetical protein CPC08DRAFT_716046 [Agrocybe pediades]
MLVIWNSLPCLQWQDTSYPLQSLPFWSTPSLLAGNEPLPDRLPPRNGSPSTIETRYPLFCITRRPGGLFSTPYTCGNCLQHPFMHLLHQYNVRTYLNICTPPTNLLQVVKCCIYCYSIIGVLHTGSLGIDATSGRFLRLQGGRNDNGLGKACASSGACGPPPPCIISPVKLSVRSLPKAELPTTPLSPGRPPSYQTGGASPPPPLFAQSLLHIRYQLRT